VATFLRAIEQASGRWACIAGSTVYDDHDNFPAALQHLHDIADMMCLAELMIYWRDGTVEHRRRSA
jgi:hypothetical protein